MTAIKEKPSYQAGIIERKYESKEWQQYNKKVWNEIYTKVPKAMLFENFFYSRCERLTDGEYSGGQWEIVEIVGGGFYFRPVCDEPFKPEAITVYGSWSSNSVSMDAFGLSLSIMCFADWQGQTESCSYLHDLYFKCRDLAFGDPTHPDSGMIFNIID